MDIYKIKINCRKIKEDRKIGEISSIIQLNLNILKKDLGNTNLFRLKHRGINIGQKDDRKMIKSTTNF